MCGIAGMMGMRGPLPPDSMREIRSMMEAQRHRGPDDQSTWSCDTVSLGHRRLAIFDTGPQAVQPMVTPDGQGVLAFNGAVYNFRELREELRREGLTFRTDSDTEVILAILHHRGPERAVSELNGMFALAYYDARTKSLWLARDRLGIKPLSLAIQPDRLLFASEDKALLACRGVSREIDTREVTLRLAFQARDAAASLFSGLEKLPPAALWRIRDGQIRREGYWNAVDVLDTCRLAAAPGKGILQRELRALLDRSVELHCRADTSLATACSSGVDSGLITAFACRWRPAFHSYVVDPKFGASEGPDAERTAGHLGVPMLRVELHAQRFLELWPRVVHHLESCGWLPSDIGLFALSERCRADGVKVLLTGEGADELFGGYEWHLADAARWRILDRPRRWLLGSRRRRNLERHLRTAPFGRPLGSASRDERRIAAISLSPAQNFLPARIMDKLAPIKRPSDRVLVGSCLHDLYTHLQELLYRHDRLSMAHGVELRVPFLENGLMDFALHLPPSARARGRQGKRLLRHLAMEHLPAENVRARKRGFPIDRSCTAGTQSLLRGGLLADTLRWSRSEAADVEKLAAGADLLRIRLVGMEMFLRLFAGSDSTDSLAEQLIRARAEAG
jgi:asparagine synthase (glutamine-hydrolysing)